VTGDPGVSVRLVRRIPVGDATVTLLTHVHGWRVRPPYAVSDAELRAAAPEADADARLPLDCTSAHVAIGSLSLVIDPGRVTRELAPRYGDAERLLDVAAALETLGVSAGEVSHLVLTHGHHDHVTGVTDDAGALLYPAARHLVARTEWEGEAPYGERMRGVLRPAAALGLLDLVDGDLELAPGLRLLRTPGETPGHLAVRIESRGEVLYWVGDLFHHRLELEHADWVLDGGDAPALRDSRRQVLDDAAGSGALIVWAHAPFGAPVRVQRTDRGFRWRDA
jgi:glyoxylase-like metal-dependent hydrolase (beta-lactamase superfamily II)